MRGYFGSVSVRTFRRVDARVFCKCICPHIDMCRCAGILWASVGAHKYALNNARVLWVSYPCTLTCNDIQVLFWRFINPL